MGDAEPLPDERVKALLGRVPSKADRERLAKVRDALGIRSTDAVCGEIVASMGVQRTSPAAAASLGAVAVAFGGICIAAGYLMAGRGRPPWGAPGPLGSVLGAPAGWLVFVLFLPAASHWVLAGWRVARSHDGLWIRAVGWVLMVGSVGLIVAGFAMLGLALRR